MPAAQASAASWTSFRSHNYPTRYLRHSNSVLRIDPTSSSSSTVDERFSRHLLIVQRRAKEAGRPVASFA